jgi:TonB family protein
MAFRALLFSKSPETSAAMTTACDQTGIRAEVCSDIFSAIEKGKTQAFSCVITDWADQPESSFLLKRARESAPNRDTLAVAVVDNEPTQAELRDNRLGFLVYRPISAEEAAAVLAKACEQMKPAVPENTAEAAGEERHANDAPAASYGASVPESSHQIQPVIYPEENAAAEEPRQRSQAIGFRSICAVVLMLAAAFCLWRSHVLEYLSQTPEGGFHVLRESVAALFHTNQTVASPVNSTATAAQPDPYFARDPASYSSNSNAPAPALGVVATESTLAETSIPLRRAPDLPLPVPTLEHADVAPIRRPRAAIPESMRNSEPIAPPVVVTVSPAQMMPPTVPQLQPVAQESSEPVAVSEEAERALLVHTVNPEYPAEALAQKLHGPVVLQARVGRDGSVEDLKIVRGYFILGRAAIAAVKQWRFQPYSLNGHAAATQTLITINFNYPPG